MRHARFVTLCLLALPLGPAALGAQTIPSPYRYVERAQSLSVFAGYLNIEPGTFSIQPRSGPQIGLRYDGRFAGPAAGELEVSFVPTGRTVYGRTNVTDPNAPLAQIADVDAYLVTAEAGLRLSVTGPRTWHGLQPSVGVLAGLVADLAGRDAAETDLPANQLVRLGPAFAVGSSVGIDWFPTERLSVRLLAKDHLWRRSIPEGLAVTASAPKEWTHNLGVTLGAALHF